MDLFLFFYQGTENRNYCPNQKWLPEPICFPVFYLCSLFFWWCFRFLHFLIFGDIWFFSSLFLSSPDFIQTLDCLDFLRQGFVPTVIPMWNLYSPDLTQWKCNVYMYRFLQFFSVQFSFVFCFVSSHLLRLSLFLSWSLSWVHLIPSSHTEGKWDCV